MAVDDIRVLVVDDSAVIRTMICDQIASTEGISVAGIARNGREAVAANAKLHPDVITLDLKMPEMDGLAVLDAVLDRSPVPVIMVSALTRAGAAITLEALDRGAVDYVAKPELGTNDKQMFTAELIHKILNVAGMDIRRVIARRKRPSREPSVPAAPPAIVEAGLEEYSHYCVALGISTGGPPALTQLLEAIRPPMPPIVIVQHMPPQFIGPLAARLNAISALSVHEAVQGGALRPNCVFLASGGIHLELHGREPNVRMVLRDAPPVSGHKPSIDVLMCSAAKVFGANCLGVIMTGMGRDGVAGCQAIRAAGGYVLGQDEASSDVYGMNRAAYIEGHVDRQFGLAEAAAVIGLQAKRLRREAVAT